MKKYKVIRAFHNVEYAYVEANSEEEAEKKAIEDDCWEENPNDIFLGYEYIVVEDNENN